MDQIGDHQTGDTGGQRIGSAERELAIEQLQQHYQAGRLTPEEYEDRSVRASRALTWAEITPLFADLPEPRPGPVRVSLVAPEQPPQGLVPLSDRARETIMAVTPLVALILFFVTEHTWLWFLAIPLVGILLYGPDRERKRRR
jgi:Domain of unknown function (DUF1707)